MKKNPVKCYNSRNFNYPYGAKLTYSVKAIYKNGDIQLIGWLSDDKLMILEKDENVLISNVQESKNKMVQEDCYLP